MADLTVETIKTPEGYDFVRSDGLRFFLVNHEDGQASLFTGRRGGPPTEGVVGFDVSVADKLEAAHQYILAYRPNPA